jgi:hypothetical protein
MRSYLAATAVLAWLVARPVLAAPPSQPFAVAGLGDCEKITKDGEVPPSPHFWDPKSRQLRLHGARNEVVGAQLILTALGGDVAGVNVETGDLQGPGVIRADPNIQLFREMYVYAHNADWENASTVLPPNKWYPEVLAPFKDPYRADRRAVAAPFTISVKNGPNQGVWIDVYIPRDAKPGRYKAAIRLTVSGRLQYTASLDLTVHDFTLPDETHVDGYGEFYGLAYEFHRTQYSQVGAEKWWAIASRYHQMAHQHRFVVMERRDRGPDERNWQDYDKTYGTILDGSLFTPQHGYFGPGENTGVTFWRAPFRQEFDGRVPDFTAEQLRSYTEGAKEFWVHLVAHHWDRRRIFAYIVDEPGQMLPEKVANLKRLQEALDAGAGKGHINLMWTSHTDPATLAANPATDLRGIIRWWAPNGKACDARFLPPRVKLGEVVWFYHHGHPANGVHGINATGVDLRTWGTICWRYKLSGSFWWAMDLTDAKEPMAVPVYDRGDSRFGNGVLFFSGARLPDVGLPAIDGPVGSLRMKAYRRGLQDYEYCWLLAEKGKQAVADALIRKVIPVALTDALPGAAGSSAASEKAEQTLTTAPAASGPAKPPWKKDPNDWYQMREALASALESQN